MANEVMIPALPCRSINEMLEFYVALGFEITYQQERPNSYAAVKREGINLHFFSMKGYEPKDSYSTCLVLVPDLAGLHQAFSASLRSHYGKLPVAGIPRISKLNKSNADRQLRFNVIDPGGNWVRFIQIGEQPESAESDSAPQKEAQTKLSRATHAADWLVEAEGDFAVAAELLDKALAQEQTAQTAPPAHHFQALVLRASLAVSLDDRQLAATLLEQARLVPLTDDERAILSAELLRASDLQHMLE